MGVETIATLEFGAGAIAKVALVMVVTAFVLGVHVMPSGLVVITPPAAPAIKLDPSHATL